MTTPSRPLADTAITRAAERLLPRLAMRGARLSPLPCDTGIPGNALPRAVRYGLFTPRNGHACPIMEVEGALVRAFFSQGWVRKSKGHVVLSAAGAAWLRRRQAGGDAFRQQHQCQKQVQRKIDGVRRKVRVNEAESPLSWLRKRKSRSGTPLISEVQYQAGERLRADFWRAQMTPRVTQDWSMAASNKRSRRASPGAGVDISDAVIAARQRVQRALEAVGPELAGVLIDVCCHLNGLEDAEKAAGWPQRSGKVVLQLALTRLARHYGLVSESEIARPLMRRIQHWGTHDYRPTIQSWTDEPAQADKP